MWERRWEEWGTVDEAAEAEEAQHHRGCLWEGRWCIDVGSCMWRAWWRERVLSAPYARAVGLVHIGFLPYCDGSGKRLNYLPLMREQ